MNIFYKVFLLAFNIEIYFVKEKEENKMRVIKFLAKHWIITTIVVTILFGIVLPNLEAELVSRGSSLIQYLLGGC